MANNVTVKLNLSGVREILKSQAVKDDIERRAGLISDRANSVCDMDSIRGLHTSPRRDGTEPYGISTSAVGRVASARVWTNTHEGMADNAQNNTLLKSLDAGR